MKSLMEGLWFVLLQLCTTILLPLYFENNRSPTGPLPRRIGLLVFCRVVQVGKDRGIGTPASPVHVQGS